MSDKFSTDGATGSFGVTTVAAGKFVEGPEGALGVLGVIVTLGADGRDGTDGVEGALGVTMGDAGRPLGKEGPDDGPGEVSVVVSVVVSDPWGEGGVKLSPGGTGGVNVELTSHLPDI